MKLDYSLFVRNVGGIDFRPVSMASLTWLYEIKSPIVMGGDINAVDFCIFAWMHGEELATVIQSMQAGDYEQQAILWGAGVPPVVFSLYTTQNIKALLKELKNAFIDPESKFCPFPSPSPRKASWWARAFAIIRRLFKRG